MNYSAVRYAVREDDFLPKNESKVKHIYNLLKNKKYFPAVTDGCIYMMLPENRTMFTQFTSYFPKYTFTLIISYGFHSSIYILTVRGTSVLYENTFYSKNHELTTDVKFLSLYMPEQMYIRNEISYLFTNEDKKAYLSSSTDSTE